MGEEPIYGMSFFEDIAEVQLEGIIDFESDKDPLEKLMGEGVTHNIFKQLFIV
ncbi:hypothetical protein [Desulfosporosinus hippei]|uniref:hypothetical protein n=1 Tax=Desulfosporosinus hippei TaxID=569859 RepID=UPI000AC6B647|nr:hypothetical protein [Desulfosporosinus hippei]